MSIAVGLAGFAGMTEPHERAESLPPCDPSGGLMDNRCAVDHRLTGLLRGRSLTHLLH